MMRFVLFILLWLPASAFAQSWTLIPSMIQARAEGAAVQLKDGTILVVGGRDDQRALDACEIYDPRTSTWSITGNLNQARYRHDVQLLPTGEVIAIGGLTDINTQTTETCELYDPKSRSWSFTDPLPEPAENIYAKRLPDGRLFASGGLNANNSQYVRFAVIYDAATHAWTRLPDMLIALDGHSIFYSTAKQMTLVASGLFGGASGVFLKSTQILRDDSSSWQPGEDCSDVHDNTQQMAIQMPDETPVLCGGRIGTSSVGTKVESFDFISERWSTIGTLVRPHWHCWAFLIGQDSIILIGGAIDPGPLQSVTAQCTWFDYTTRSSTPAPTLIQPRNLYAATKVVTPLEEQCIHKEFVYVFGGQDQSHAILRTCERLDMGVRANAAVLSIAPSSIGTLIGCHALDTILSLKNHSCSAIHIDSIVAADDELKVTSTVPMDVATNDSVRIPIRLTFNQDTVNSAIKVILHSAAGLEVRWIHVAGLVNRQGGLSALTTGLTPRAVCSDRHDTVIVHNSQCDPAIIEHVWIEGSDAASYLIEQSPAEIVADSSGSVTYQLLASDARQYTATLVIATFSNGKRDTLRQQISIQTTGGAAVVGRTVMTDRRVFAGDTVNVPLRLVTTAKSSALGAQIELTYDKDLLELLEPDFSGTLAGGGADYDINLTSRGASLFIPGDIRIENGTIVNLRFRTFVTKNSCTTLKLSSLLLSPDDPKFTTCVLSANLDSATICLDPRCGDNEIRDVLNGTPPELSAAQQGDLIRLSLHGWGTPAIAVYDQLGERLGVSYDSRQHTITSSSLPSGIYYVRASENGFTRTTRLSVNH